MRIEDDECWWCEGYWDAWATDCPTHSDSRALSAADKRRILGFTDASVESGRGLGSVVRSPS